MRQSGKNPAIFLGRPCPTRVCTQRHPERSSQTCQGVSKFVRHVCGRHEPSLGFIESGTDKLTHSWSSQLRHLHRPQSWVRLEWQGRIRCRHCSLGRRHMVRTKLHRHGWRRFRFPDWRRYQRGESGDASQSKALEIHVLTKSAVHSSLSCSTPRTPYLLSPRVATSQSAVNWVLQQCVSEQSIYEQEELALPCLSSSRAPSVSAELSTRHLSSPHPCSPTPRARACSPVSRWKAQF